MNKKISISIPGHSLLLIPASFLAVTVYDYLTGVSMKRIAFNTVLQIGAAGLGGLSLLKLLTCGDGTYTGELCYEKDGAPIWKMFSKDGKCEFVTGPETHK